MKHENLRRLIRLIIDEGFERDSMTDMSPKEIAEKIVSDLKSEDIIDGKVYIKQEDDDDSFSFSDEPVEQTSFTVMIESETLSGFEKEGGSSFEATQKILRPILSSLFDHLKTAGFSAVRSSGESMIMTNHTANIKIPKDPSGEGGKFWIAKVTSSNE